LDGENAGRESWRLPTYGLLDVYMGASFNITKKYGIAIRASIFNVLNTKYISDAQNNGVDSGNTNFDASSADVFFGQGTRWSMSIAFQLF
jgi:outer membrane receptor protein involved in Fe transport